MNNYIRGSDIEQKFVIYDTARDKYVKTKLIDNRNMLEIHYVEDVQDATFCNSMAEVAKDLEQAGIAITSKIKIIGISISLIITPDFIIDYSHKVKKSAEADFKPVPRDPALEKLEKDIKEAQGEMMDQYQQKLREEIKQRHEENMAGDYNPSDISTNKFLWNR